MYDHDCKISHAHSKIGGLAGWLNCGGGGGAGVGGGGGDSESDEDDDPTVSLAEVVEHDGDYDEGGYDHDIYKDEGEGGNIIAPVFIKWPLDRFLIWRSATELGGGKC